MLSTKDIINIERGKKKLMSVNTELVRLLMETQEGLKESEVLHNIFIDALQQKKILPKEAAEALRIEPFITTKKGK